MKSIEKWESAWIKVEEKIHFQQSLLSGRQEKKLPFSDMFEMPSDIFLLSHDIRIIKWRKERKVFQLK